MHVVLVGPEFEENLSLRYLAAALRAAGQTASLARFDSAEHIEGVVSQVMREQPGLVGLSLVFQVRAREYYELARALRRAGYAGHLTAGGHFATFAYEPMLADLPELDSVVRQEGEETIVELASALEAGRGGEALVQIPGMVVGSVFGQPLVAPPRRQADPLDTLPFPARDTPPERHLGVPTAFLVGSRGCYADCEYCCIFAWHEAAVGKRYRMRTPANLAEEMAVLYHERGVRFFVFHDDNFFLPTAAGNRKRFEALRSEIQARDLRDIGLMLKLRPNDCDRENLLILKELGLLRVFVGIENASGRQLRTLGRDSSLTEVQDCLALLRELDTYATYNLLLFDPYTTLEDIAENLAFLRDHLYYPFNWCKVEPYAGTALEKRYAREERLFGDYLGWGYTIQDPRARVMYDLLLPAVYHRNFDYFGLSNLNIGLGYHRQLLRHFYPDRAATELVVRAQALVEAINADALGALERAFEFARTADPADEISAARFGEELKQECFRAQRALSPQVEAVMRAMEAAAGVREASRSNRSEAFTPLLPAGPALPKPGVSRRGWLAVLGSSLVWALAGCRSRPAPAPGTPALTGPPQGMIQVAHDAPDTVAPQEELTLEALLFPEDAVVVGEPRVTCSDGTIRETEPLDGRRRLRIRYAPAGGSRQMDPNVTVSVAWTVRGKDTDTTVVARAFVHLNADGSYAFGYETPRPTIAEMAAPPIYQGPNPNINR